MFGDYHIISNDKRVPISTKVITWLDDPSLKARPGAFYDLAKKNKVRSPHLFVNHWDACVSSRQCFDKLWQRNLSVHFLIDADGTIYQTLDTNNIAWHAAPFNTASIGVEINNPFHIEFQPISEKIFKKRPVLQRAQVHGKIKENFLTFLPEQINALKCLWLTISELYNIPLATPLDESGRPILSVVDDLKSFSGFVHHYQISLNKIDCAGFDIKKHLEEVKLLNETQKRKASNNK